MHTSPSFKVLNKCPRFPNACCVTFKYLIDEKKTQFQHFYVYFLL